jgi:ApaG protein
LLSNYNKLFFYNGISNYKRQKISVLTTLKARTSKNYKIHFAFSYQVTIENHSSVQLTSRHWEIYDSLNNIEIVDGEGVIGKTSFKTW